MFSLEEKNILKNSIKAAIDGPFFPEWEFQTLLGVYRKELKDFYDNWNNRYFMSQEPLLKITSVLGMLISYPHKQNEILISCYGVSPDNLNIIFNKLLNEELKFKDIIKTELLQTWDPIGFKDIPEAKDEYDLYVGDIYNLLHENISEEDLFEYLWNLETERMGLLGDKNKTHSFAHRLKTLTLS